MPAHKVQSLLKRTHVCRKTVAIDSVAVAACGNLTALVGQRQRAHGLAFFFVIAHKLHSLVGKCVVYAWEPPLLHGIEPQRTVCALFIFEPPSQFRVGVRIYNYRSAFHHSEFLCHLHDVRCESLVVLLGNRRYNCHAMRRPEHGA